ncbi:MAG: hypothetical protein RLZZ135_64, partial [Cyanobacteriota bacterium]
FKQFITALLRLARSDFQNVFLIFCEVQFQPDEVLGTIYSTKGLK